MHLCRVHCPGESAAGLGVLAAMAVVCAAGVWVLQLALPLLPAFALTVLGTGAVLVWPVVRLAKYGAVGEVFRRHRRPAATRLAALPASSKQIALPVGTSLAIEAPQPVVEGVIIDMRERTRHG